MKNVFYRATFFILLICMSSNCKNGKRVDRNSQEHRLYKNDLNKLNDFFKADSIAEFKLVKSIPAFIQNFIEEISHEKFRLADSISFFWDAADAKMGDYVDTTISESGKKILGSVSDSDEIDKGAGKTQVNIPDKKLIAFGLGNRTAFISYIQGGFVGQPKFYLFSFLGETIDDYWYGDTNTPITNKHEAKVYLEEKIRLKSM